MRFTARVKSKNGLRIAFPATPFFSEPFALPGGEGYALPFPRSVSLCLGGKSISFFFPASSFKSRVSRHLPPLLSLFALFKRVNSFAIKQIQPLFAKHRGGGTPAHIRAGLYFRRHMYHVPPLSPAVSVDCAYFPSPRGRVPQSPKSRHSPLSLATCPLPPLLSQPPFARFLYPAYTSKARRTTPCSACKHFAPKCVRPCAWRCRWSLPRLAG